MDLLSQFDPLSVPLPPSPSLPRANPVPATPFTSALLNPYNRPRRPLPLVSSPPRRKEQLIDLATPAPSALTLGRSALGKSGAGDAASTRKGVHFAANFRPGDSSLLSDTSTLGLLNEVEVDVKEGDGDVGRRDVLATPWTQKKGTSEERKKKKVKEETHFFSSDSPPSTIRKPTPNERVREPSSILKKSTSAFPVLGGAVGLDLGARLLESDREEAVWKRGERGNKKHSRSRSVSVSSPSVSERFNNYYDTESPKPLLSQSIRPSSALGTPNDSTFHCYSHSASLMNSTLNLGLNLDQDVTSNLLMNEGSSFLLDQTDLTLSSWHPTPTRRPISTSTPTSSSNKVLKLQTDEIDSQSSSPLPSPSKTREQSTLRAGRVLLSSREKDGVEGEGTIRRAGRVLVSQREGEEGTMRAGRVLPPPTQVVEEFGTIRASRTLPKENEMGTVRSGRTRTNKEEGTVRRRDASRPRTPAKRVQLDLLRGGDTPPSIGSGSSGSRQSEKSGGLVRRKEATLDAEGGGRSEVLGMEGDTKDLKGLLEAFKEEGTRDIMGETIMLQESTTTLDISNLPPLPPIIPLTNEKKSTIKGSRLLERIKEMKRAGEDERKKKVDDIRSLRAGGGGALTEKALEEFLNHEASTDVGVEVEGKSKGVERWAKKTSKEAILPSPEKARSRNPSPTRRPPSRQLNLPSQVTGGAGAKENLNTSMSRLATRGLPKPKPPVSSGISKLARRASKDEFAQPPCQTTTVRMTRRTSNDSFAVPAAPQSKSTTTSSKIRKPSVDMMAPPSRPSSRGGTTASSSRNPGAITNDGSSRLPSRKASIDASSVTNNGGPPNRLSRHASIDYGRSTSQSGRTLTRKASVDEFGASKLPSLSRAASVSSLSGTRQPSARAAALLAKMGRGPPVGAREGDKGEERPLSRLPSLSSSVSGGSRLAKLAR
ncbi:hypothetical protein BT69DRAFT_1354362 [Atractiella rhizophila]|nr:hypothetical protein BT69DRAFT_1354362 [Atractiella rhizophila]